MKKGVHPKWYKEAAVTCACGNTFTVGTTVPEIRVEVCAMCHPFYTGQMKYVDTAGRVESFKAKQAKATRKVLSKVERRKIKRMKRIKEELERPTTLRELRKTVKRTR